MLRPDDGAEDFFSAHLQASRMLGHAQDIIIGPPTHSVEGQNSNGRWRLSSSVVCRLAYAT